MHIASNLLVFPNSMFTPLLFFHWKCYVLSGEIALKNNHYYYYYYFIDALSLGENARFLNAMEHIMWVNEIRRGFVKYYVGKLWLAYCYNNVRFHIDLYEQLV